MSATAGGSKTGSSSPNRNLDSEAALQRSCLQTYAAYVFDLWLSIERHGALYASRAWDDYTNECREIAGRSGLIEVGYLNWGRVLSLSGTPMKAACFIIGNPLTAQKLLSAGGAQVGLYLPTKLLVFEDGDGATHVSYDKFLPIMAMYGDAALNKVAGAIDVVLDKLATVAVN